jgi:selenide, water dikinase
VNTNKAPAYKHLVLLGGGHSHVSVIKSFGMKPVPGVAVTVVCRDVHTPYSGMLPGLIAGHYGFDEAHIDLDKLCAFSQINFIHDEVVGLDPITQKLKFRGRPDLAYDVLSINTGSSPDVNSVPGAKEFAVPVKPINSFLDHWNKLESRLENTDKPVTVAVVGAGAGGIELLLSVQNRINDSLIADGKNPSLVNYKLLVSGDELLPTHNAGVRKCFKQKLTERGVQTDYMSRVGEVKSNGLVLENGSFIEADEILWVTSAAAPAWPKLSGLDVDDRGFIKVNDKLQTLSFPNIFAAGDVAAVVNHPREKAGVFAVRQGPPLMANLRGFLLGDELKDFKPQKTFLGLISTGDKYAVASWGPLAFSGAWVWRWKDKIDRKFMNLYSVLEPMRIPAVEIAPTVLGSHKTPDPMRCNGCAAKVGSGVLTKVMRQLRDSHPALFPALSGDDAAVLNVPKEKSLIQSVDFFRSFIGDPFTFGKIAANHCLNDLYAMGVQPHSALAIVALEPASNERQEDELKAALSGALEVFTPLGVLLAGGHTAEFSEPGLGFTVNGFANESQIIPKQGLKSGDDLVLTKALGTGILLAGQMRLATKGRWIEEALQSMMLSNHTASEVFFEHEAESCTDITGFGLLGHLLEMIGENDDIAVEINMNALRELSGVKHLLAQGIASSLAASNNEALNSVDVSKIVSPEMIPLLTDPQTAGGLLGAVKAEKTLRLISALQNKGYDKAHCVGRVVERNPGDQAIKLI